MHYIIIRDFNDIKSLFVIFIYVCVCSIHNIFCCIRYIMIIACIYDKSEMVSIKANMLLN